MLYLIIGLFAVAAVFGLTILTGWLRKRNVSRTVVFSHGGFAAIALVLLIVYALQHPEAYPQLSLILFIVAALGGFYMFFREMNTGNKSTGVAVVHALLAVTAFVALLVFAFA